jgi:FAD:protein FMN transferase
MTNSAQVDRHVHTEHVMGTVVSFDVRDVPANLAREVIAEACRDLHRIDRTFSTYRADSAIRRIDRGDLDPQLAGDDVRWILRRCEELREETDGWFDARATGQLDPSALVKGWAVQRASDHLLRSGVYDHCVGAGGDIACTGGALPTDHWRIGIQHPLDRGALAAIAELRGGAIATSGLYERGDHIVAPPTGAAPGEVLSVSVSGPDLGLADAYATAAFAMGAAGPEWTATLRGYEALTILADGRVLRTPGFPLTTTTTDAAADDSALGAQSTRRAA